MFGLTGSSGSLGMGVSMSLYDNFSANADKIMVKYKELEGVTNASVTRMESSMNKMQMGFAGLGVGLAILATTIFLPVKSAAAFEQQLSGIKAVSGATTIEMEKLRQTALTAGTDIGFSAIESAAGIEELIKAGVGVQEIANGGLRGALLLSAAGEISVADAAEIASTALNAFRDDQLSVIDAANILAGASNASATDVISLKMGLSQTAAVAAGLGVTFKDTATGLAVFAQNGLKGSDAGTSFKNMLSNLQPRTDQQMKTMLDLGLAQGKYVTDSKGVVKGAQLTSNAFFDSHGKAKSLAEMADVLSNATKNLTAKERDYALETLFGNDSKRAALILSREGAKGVNDMADAMGKVTAEQVAQERLNNLNGMWKIFKSNMETTSILIGANFLAPFKSILGLFNGLIVIIQKFAATRLGELIFTIAGAVGVLVTALSLYVIVTNASRWASAKAAISFAAMGNTAVATAFETGGLTAGMSALATSIWAALAPLIPFVAAALLIASPFIIGYAAIQQFNKVLEGTEKPASGFLGFMQKIGGVLKTAIAAFSSWDGKKFQLSEGLVKALDDMGIKDTALAIATWVIRIKNFFMGFIQGLKQVWGVAKAIFSAIGDVVNKVFDSLGIEFGKNTSSMDKWAKYGKWAAYIIGTIMVVAIGALTVSLFSMAVAVVAATWPILLIIGVIVLIVLAIKNWGAIMDWLRDKVVQAFVWIAEQISSFVGWIMDLPGRMYNAGKNMVIALKDGIVSMWDSFKAWITDKISALWEAINPSNWFGGNNVEAAGSIAPNSNLQPQSFASGFAQNESLKLSMQQPVVFDKTTTKTESIENHIYLDGDKIHNNMMNRSKQDEANSY